MSIIQDIKTPIRLLIIGDSGVGKSSIITRYTDETFDTNYLTTIGIDFKIKRIVIDNKRYKLQIWDTAGQERFRTITTNYYRGAMGIIIAYDVTNHMSFESVNRWVGNIRENMYQDKPVVCVLVGNKTDLERVISRERGEELARQNNIKFFECSSKNNIGINEIFESLTRDIIEKVHLDKITNNIVLQNNERKKCC